jgi:hypothetical protein
LHRSADPRRGVPAGRLNRRPVRLPAAEPAQTRQLLRKLLVGRLVWTPRVDAHGVASEYAAQVSYGRILAALVDVKRMVPPEGSEASYTRHIKRMLGAA